MPHFPDHYVWKHWPYKAVPEPKVSPPEPPIDAYERNVRNSIRQDIIDRCGTILDRMQELRWNCKKYRQTLEAIIGECRADFEDE